MKTTVSFEIEGPNPEVIAQIRELVTRLDPAAAIVEPTNVRVSRPKRVLTEAERQAIRNRFAAGKARAALARGEVVVPVPAIEVTANPVHRVNADVKPATLKTASKALPMPVKGRKVPAKPAAK